MSCLVILIILTFSSSTYMFLEDMTKFKTCWPASTECDTIFGKFEIY